MKELQSAKGWASEVTGLCRAFPRVDGLLWDLLSSLAAPILSVLPEWLAGSGYQLQRLWGKQTSRESTA